MTEQMSSEQPEKSGDVTVPPPAPHNSLAVAAFVLGLIAFIGGFTPVWGIFVGSIAVALGVFALQKPTLKPLSIIGIVAGSIGVLASLLFSLVLFIGVLADK